MRVIWTREAAADRHDLWHRIEADDPAAAIRMDQLIGEAADRLGEFPLLGRRAKVPGTREIFPHDSYRLVYEVEGDVVWVLAVVHVARQWPPARGR
ncbi:MAG: type II toxin-antitoxin system RelE/ParE family toxin [Dongiaceae bacterium]